MFIHALNNKRAAMKTTHLFIIVPFALALVGCAGIKAQTDYDDTVDFGAYRSYGYMERPTEGVLAGNDLVINRIERAVDRQLGANGYQKMETGSPDFYVVYHAALEERITATTIDQWGYGWRHWGRWGGRSEVLVETYEEGTLIIDIVDASTKELVWRGQVQGRVQEDPERSKQGLDKAVAIILEAFPPPPGS